MSTLIHYEKCNKPQLRYDGEHYKWDAGWCSGNSLDEQFLYSSILQEIERRARSAGLEYTAPDIPEDEYGKPFPTDAAFSSFADEINKYFRPGVDYLEGSHAFACIENYLAGAND